MAANESEDSQQPGSAIRDTLAHRDFTLLAVGQLFGQVAVTMQQVVVAWQIYEITDSPLSVGLTGLARGIPIILFSLMGGVVADAMDRRKVILYTQTVTLGCAAILTALTLDNRIEPWMIYGVVAILGIVTSFDFPARRALIPTLVNSPQVPSAATLMLVVRRGSGIVGPAIAGPLIGFFGVATGHWAVVACLVLLILCVLLMRVRGVVSGSGSRAGLGMFAEGFKFLWSVGPLFSILVIAFFLFLFTNTRSVWPALSRDIFEAGPTGLGLLASSASIGTVIGLTIALRLHNFQRKGLLAILCAMGMGCAVLVLSAAPVLAVAAIALVLFGILDSINDSVRHVLISTVTPNALQGRVNSVATAFASGGVSLGEPWTGFLATALGPRHGLALAGGVVAVGTVLLLLLGRPLVRYRGSEVQGHEAGKGC